MWNFLRAIRDALRYWPSLCLAMACSMGVAMLWGGNIGAIYPVMQVTFDEKNLQQWVDEQIAGYDSRIAILTAEVDKYQKRLDAGEVVIDADKGGSIERKIQSLQGSIQTEQAGLIYYQGLEKWVDKYCPTDLFQTVCWVMGLVLISTLVKSCMLVCNEWLVAKVSNDIARDVRRKIFERALEFDRGTFLAYGTSGFAAQIVYTADGLAQGLTNLLGGAIREPLKVLSCLIGAGFICWRLLLVSLLIAPIVGLFLYWIGRKLRQVSTKVLSRSVGLHEVMLEALGNIQTVQAYTMEPAEKARFAQTTLDMRNCAQRVVLLMTLSKPVVEILGLGMIASAILAGAYLILYKETSILGFTISDQPLTAPAMLGFFGLLIGASDPLRKLGAIMQFINGGMIAANNLYPMLDMQSRIRDPEQPKEVAVPHRCLDFQAIQFGYHPDHIILCGVDLSIDFGKTICIVGANGTGKSTLMQLACRFYDPALGNVRLDGVDVRDMTIESLRSRIALVTQHTELFNRSVYENIRYGSPHCTEEEIYAAARLAHADDFINNQLREGYQTIVGPGGQYLSGGQRQRIALARALLRKPEILILDESTSQIDMQSELLIRESLAAIRGKQTILIITHRHALLELADEVYELRDCKLHRIDRLASVERKAA